MHSTKKVFMKMKVAVITRHAVSNYGSLLQAMATQRVIEQLGYPCEIIDYIRPDETYSQQEKTLLKDKPYWNHSLLKRAVYLMIRQPAGIVVGRQFERWRQKYLKLTKRYETLEQLISDMPAADVYITGSDQVWGPVGGGTYDSVYCLSFTASSEKRVSYAASFGHTDMTPERKEYYQKWLGRYAHIAVREDSAVEILNSIGIGAEQVLDPTLLLGADDWNGLITPVKEKKYILVYQIHNDKKVGEYAKKVAAAKGLKLIRISVSPHQAARPGKFVWLPSVGRFLAYIKNAECVITDSFHATAFAINFNTPLVVILPNNHTQTRNLSILKMTGLLDRVLCQDDDVAIAYKAIDFAQVNQILSEQRKKSLELLRQMISE